MLTKSQEAFLTVLFYGETSIRIPSAKEGECVNTGETSKERQKIDPKT